MFRIFITAKALADIYLQESEKEYAQQSEWFHILLKQKKIYTIGYIPPSGDILEEDGISDSEIVSEMSTAYEIAFLPNDSYINSINDDHSKVFEYPNAAFVLDIEEAEAKEIQEHYGVICKTAEANVDASVFTDECIRHDYIKTRPVSGGWKDLFEVQKSVPSNAMCIIDRYLFAEDGREDANNPDSLQYNGLDNVMMIFHS